MLFVELSYLGGWFVGAVGLMYVGNSGRICGEE